MKLGTNDEPITLPIHLIIINALLWGAAELLPRMDIDLIDKFGLHYWEGSSFNPIQLVTYMFLHGGFTHLFFNMFNLFMFGPVLERVMGTKKFLFYYFFTGIGAGLVQQLAWAYDLQGFTQEVNMFMESGISNGLDLGNGQIIHTTGELTQFADTCYNSHITIGASGAVFALLLAFGMLFPNAPLYLFFIPVPIKAKYMVVGYAIIELFAGVKDFNFDNVAHFAHLGGMLFGIILLLYWRQQGKRRQQQMQSDYGR